jgi:hypothetical protein
MANALYDKGREKYLTAALNWSSDDIRAVLVDTADYVVDLANHEFLSSVPSAARVATLSAGLSGKTTTAGVADANNITFTAVSGDPSEAVILYKHTGVDTTASLIAYMDTASSGLPVTPNGGDINVNWSDGSNKIFKL